MADEIGWATWELTRAAIMASLRDSGHGDIELVRMTERPDKAIMVSISNASERKNFAAIVDVATACKDPPLATAAAFLHQLRELKAKL